VVDLFGKIRRSEQAGFAELLAAEANRQALRHAIIAQVVRSRAQIATLQRRLQIARDTTASWQQSVDIVERRYARGLVGPLDVRLARENLAASQSAHPRIEDQLSRAQMSLDVLLGRRPGTTNSLPKTLDELPDLSPPPVGMPASLLDRRPDLQAAEMRLAAATSRVGVSIARMFPDLTLTGNYGFRGDRLSDLLLDENAVYSAAARLLQPIFQGGQLRAQVDASRARVEEETARYAGLVLNALREVEDALVREEMLRRELTALEIRYTEAHAAHELAWQRYLQGVESVITILETQRRRRFAETELAVIKGSFWTNRVDLFLALGGDWEPSQNDNKDEQ
jgi:multidrug efflux system outer membrane protein